MSPEQKQKISRMRHERMSYLQIASELGIPENTVKSYCRRNNLGAVKITMEEKPAECKCCGRPLVQGRKGHPSKFCSEECRRTWWKVNDGQLVKKAWYTLTCAYCNKEFESYGNRKRKFCGHECYIARRFGKAGDGYDERAV